MGARPCSWSELWELNTRSILQRGKARLWAEMGQRPGADPGRGRSEAGRGCKSPGSVGSRGGRSGGRGAEGPRMAILSGR